MTELSYIQNFFGVQGESFPPLVRLF
jgi:hypothetical protein